MAYSLEKQIVDFKASSAGTRAVIAHPIHHNAALVLEAMGGDASRFSARQLTPKIAAGADLILTMTRAHREIVLEHAPHQLQRTFSLGEASRLASAFNAKSVADLAENRAKLSAREFIDIPDPIGQHADVFAKVCSQISSLLQPILELCRP